MFEQDRSYALDFNKPNLPTLSLHHSTQDSSEAGGDSLWDNSTTDSLNVNWTHKGLTTNLTLNRIVTNSQPRVSPRIRAPREQHPRLTRNLPMP